VPPPERRQDRLQTRSTEHTLLATREYIFLFSYQTGIALLHVVDHELLENIEVEKARLREDKLEVVCRGDGRGGRDLGVEVELGRLGGGVLAVERKGLLEGKDEQAGGEALAVAEKAVVLGVAAQEVRNDHAEVFAVRGVLLEHSVQIEDGQAGLGVSQAEALEQGQV